MDEPSIIKDRDLKFYIWLLTYNQYPREKICRYENNQKVKNFDEYDTYDSRGLLYEEESIREVPIVRKEKQGFTHWSMPMYLFHDNKAFSGTVEKKDVARTNKRAKTDEHIISMYIWENKHKPEVIVAPVPVETVRKARPEQKEKLEHTPMPMYMYHQDTVYKGKFSPNIQKEPKKTPKKVVTDIQPIYIYKPESVVEFVEPESSKKIIPKKVKPESSKKIIETPVKVHSKNNPIRPDVGDEPVHIIKRPLFHLNAKKSDDFDMPSAQLPKAPDLETTFEPTETREDVSPVILIPATLREDSPEKPKEEPRKELNPNLMRSYREQTQNVEKSRLTKLDDFDNGDDMFVPMEPHKKDPKDCQCPMCVKNKSRIKRPRPMPKKKKKNPMGFEDDEDLEKHQKNKLESRINRLPKLNKPRRIQDPYKNRKRQPKSRPVLSQPEMKPDFSVSFAKFLKKNIETKEIKSKPFESKNDKYLDDLGDDPTPRGKSKTSLGTGDNLDTYFDNQRRR